MHEVFNKSPFYQRKQSQQLFAAFILVRRSLIKSCVFQVKKNAITQRKQEYSSCAADDFF